MVLDTNILISSCWTPDGLEARTLALACDGAFTMCVSAEIWAEYNDVLSREKFAAFRPAATQLLAKLDERVFRAEAASRLNVASDPDDNRFLECAAAAEARYLVTGNLKHYPTSWEAARVVNARQFLTAEFGEWR